MTSMGKPSATKFSGTYVVKIGAQPAGRGKVVFRLYEIAFYNCMFREVEVTAKQPPIASSTAFRSTSL